MVFGKVARPPLRWAPIRSWARVVLLVVAACVLGCGAAPPPALMGMRASWDCGDIIGDPARDLLEAVECEQDHWYDHYSENHDVDVDWVTLDADVESSIADALTMFARARPSPASGEAIQRLVSDADLGAWEDEVTEVSGLIVGKTIVSTPPMLLDVIPECGEGGCGVSVRLHEPDTSDGPDLDEPDLGSLRLWTQACELCLPRAVVAADEAYWREARIGDLVGFDRRGARKEACSERWLDLDPEECPFPVDS
jgi:hypothetical protein